MFFGFYNKSFIKSPWASYLFQARLRPGVREGVGGGGLDREGGLIQFAEMGHCVAFSKNKKTLHKELGHKVEKLKHMNLGVLQSKIETIPSFHHINKPYKI